MSESAKTRRLWHITPRKNLTRILQKGLEPRIGPRSRLMAERVKAIYFFPNASALVDALSNWFGEELGEENASLLEVTVPEEWIIRTCAPFWEERVVRTIPPRHIRVLLEDVDHFTGAYPEGLAPREWTAE